MQDKGDWAGLVAQSEDLVSQVGLHSLMLVSRPSAHWNNNPSTVCSSCCLCTKVDPLLLSNPPHKFMRAGLPQLPQSGSEHTAAAAVCRVLACPHQQVQNTQQSDSCHKAPSSAGL
eukprot:1159929-Pelagomonas_calceolata.AAC.10